MLDPTAIYVIVVIFIATLIRSSFGFGEALVAVPLLALRIPIPIAAPLAVLFSVIISGIVVVQDWHHIEIHSAAWLVIAAMFGIPLGLILLAKADEHLVKMILGLVIALFSLYSLTAKLKLHVEKDHPIGLVLCGFLSGILGGAYGMNGPPLAVYGALRRWSPQRFRATLQGYFLPVSLVGLIGYIAIGLWVPEVTRCFLISAPGALLAVAIGRAINYRLRGDGFFRYVYLGLIVIGIILVIQALA